MHTNFKKLNFLIISLILFLISLGILSLILLMAQTNPGSFLKVIFVEPWKNLNNFSSFVNIFSVLLLVGLAIAVTFKYRIYNFGVPGQMLFSVIITYILAVAIAKAGGSSRAISLFLLLLAVIVGCFSGLIIAILKNYFAINEIISTILFNFIALEGYKALLSSNFYHNYAIPNFASLKFSLLSGPLSASNLFSAGIIIAIVVLIITSLLLNNRTIGFKLNAIAKNPVAARQARIDVKKQMLVVFPIAGAISGLAGYLYFLATNNNLPEINNLPQEGFYGISIAALAFYEPALIIFTTLLITLFVRPIEFNSFIYLTNPQLAVVLLGIVIYLLAIFPFIWYLFDQSPRIQEKWYKFKLKVFHISKNNNKKFLLENSQQQEVIQVDVNKIENNIFKTWWLKFWKLFSKKQKGDK